MRGVITQTFREAVIQPRESFRHVLGELTPGKIYPCVVLTKPEFETLGLPADTRRVVLIRDLRDTLVSFYFSVRNTHPVIGQVERWRWFLQRFDQEQGLLYMIDALHQAVRVQRSWLEAGERVMKLEEFMTDPAAAFRRLFREFWRLDVSEETLERLAANHSFERYSGGRSPGQEDLNSHYRKGVHGDWRKHFTPKVLETFKARHGDLLIRAGYEKDDSWSL